MLTSLAAAIVYDSEASSSSRSSSEVFQSSLTQLFFVSLAPLTSLFAKEADWLWNPWKIKII